MKSILLLLVTAIGISCFAQKQLKLDELKDHIGDSVSVSGKVTAIRYLETAKNTPTFINVGGVYPNQALTIVIWGDVRKQFTYDLNKKELLQGVVKVSGKVELYKDKPQIVVKDPKQLTFIYDEEVPTNQIPPIEKKKNN